MTHLKEKVSSDERRIVYKKQGSGETVCIRKRDGVYLVRLEEYSILQASFAKSDVEFNAFSNWANERQKSLKSVPN